jgi:hypothetical protein
MMNFKNEVIQPVGVIFPWQYSAAQVQVWNLISDCNAQAACGFSRKWLQFEVGKGMTIMMNYGLYIVPSGKWRMEKQKWWDLWISSPNEVEGL